MHESQHQSDISGFEQCLCILFFFFFERDIEREARWEKGKSKKERETPKQAPC